MSRIIKSSLLAGILVFVAALSGCASNITADSPSEPKPNVTDATVVNALCGDEAVELYESIVEAANSEPNSGKRNQLKEYGIGDPADDAALTEIVATLEVRANTSCDETAANTTEGEVGVEDRDGAVRVVPLIEGDGETTVLLDSTTNPSTPPLLDGSLRFTAQTLTWAGLVERVGDQQWYIDGVNARAAYTGFTWDDVLRFADANRMESGKVVGANALAIQVFNRPDLTDEQIRNDVRRYITPAVEETIGLTVDELPIQRINNGFMNTRNIGSKTNPQMGDYFDTQRMIRVSLMPLKFDADGNVIGLDGTRGAGVFIDCGNLHWVPLAVWECTEESCKKPECPPGTVGTPPNCTTPEPECKKDCGNTPKDWDKTPDGGWTPLEPGPLTDGRETERQRESGEVRDNAIDNPVPSGTGTDDTTPDFRDGSVTIPGASQGGDNRTDDVVDESVTNQDEGGTNGDTCIADPDSGVSNCG